MVGLVPQPLEAANAALVSAVPACAVTRLFEETPEFVTLEQVTPATVIAGVPVKPPAVPVVFWFKVGKVQFVSVPLAGVPSAGATKVIPEAIVPATMLAAGNPEQFVSVPEAGVPRAGATKVMPEAIVPATMLAAGSPEQFVKVPEAGVPKAGVVNVGEVNVLFVRVCDAAKVTTVSDDPGNVMVVPSVPANVKLFETVSVLVLVTLKPVTVALLPVQEPALPEVF